jgi:hypothetical protein
MSVKRNADTGNYGHPTQKFLDTWREVNAARPLFSEAIDTVDTLVLLRQEEAKSRTLRATAIAAVFITALTVVISGSLLAQINTATAKQDAYLRACTEQLEAWKSRKNINSQEVNP